MLGLAALYKATLADTSLYRLLARFCYHIPENEPAQ